MVELQFLQVDIKGTATIGWKDNLLSSWNYASITIKMTICIYVGLFLDSIIFIDIYVLIPNTTHHWLSQICSKSWSGSITLPVFFSLRNILAVLGSLHSFVNCKVCLPISTKKKMVSGILIEIESMDKLW